MSTARILSILNGKPMLESSDTSETDDSGPSLEIISDTEEWLTDDDTSKKENGKQGKLVKRDKTNIKRKPHIKKNDPDKSNSKAKCSIKNENNDKTNKNVKIKKEDDKEDKGKEGDSLLDLLELEMRARAIRALIRKEEDIIPSTNSSEINDSQTIENDIRTRHDDDKAKENCRKQLEQIISAQQNKGEDEDVVLVIQPTPVVELLSSDSDGEVHDETRVNQKLKNEHAMETGKSASNSVENIKNSSKTLKNQLTEAHNNIVTKTNLSSETRTIMPDRNVDIKNNTLSISISADNVAERRKKSKKKSHTKLQLTSSISENTSNLKQISTEIIEQSNDVQDVNTIEQLSLSENENTVIMEEKNKTKEIPKENTIEEEKLADLDEIIDLDDYCDVVMDIENCDESQDEIIIPFQEEHKQSTSEATLPKSDSMETWASRYYQTDDVQNVIKESKIQSEIRKRLRERQRLSKLSKSPNLNSSSQSSSTDTTVTSEKIPTGSVEEYLALKRAMNANVSTTNNNNNTTQNNPSETINSSNNDTNVKEISVQDENISSQEYTNNDAQKVVTSEITESTELAAAIADTKSDTNPDTNPVIQPS
ncbi:hypothetical protein ACFW04_009511 [Cataglyphis niger]